MISVPEAQIDDLRRRVSQTRWPQEVDGPTWDRGVPVSYLRPIAEHWAQAFDWRSWEERLNAVPQYVTEIDGQRLHFLHARSAEVSALPLILTHGWPGSVFEFLSVLGPLTDPAKHGGDPADAFHIVAPSLPGFGFSVPLSETGWTHARIARCWAVLMQRLNYKRYGAQGGDSGFLISPELGRIASGEVVGVHINGGLELPPPDLDASGFDPADVRRITLAHRLRRDAVGYAEIQGTRPKTLSFALTDSPVGLLAWILDKVRDWTDPALDLPELAIPLDHLLANVSLYWFSGTAGTSAHLYYETRNTPAASERSLVPTGVAVFPSDTTLRVDMERRHNLVHWSEFDRGGHFAAMEAPDLLVADMRSFFRPLR